MASVIFMREPTNISRPRKFARIGDWELAWQSFLLGPRFALTFGTFLNVWGELADSQLHRRYATLGEAFAKVTRSKSKGPRWAEVGL